MSLNERPRLTKKSQLDRAVALIVGEKIQDVSLITEVFLEAVAGQLAALNDVQLDGLGRLHVALRQGPVAPLNGAKADTRWKTKYHVTFKKSVGLRRRFREMHGAIEEMDMDKLGVDESQADNEKVASKGCPECGAKVERHGNVLACPTHGTEPFEKKTK